MAILLYFRIFSNTSCSVTFTQFTFDVSGGFMKPGKTCSVIEMYEGRLQTNGVPKVRMDPKKTFKDLSIDELLAHAHYLCDGVKEYAHDPEKKRKAGSHLTSVQLCLSFAGWYTLEDLMNHNRPD